VKTQAAKMVDKNVSEVPAADAVKPEVPAAEVVPK
jgi:hypothetical protein